MAINRIAVAASGLAAAGLIAGGASLAYADGTTPAPTQSSSPAAAGGQTTQADAPGAQGQQGAQGQRGGSADTPVTGDEAQKVIDAVQTKNTGVTITEVRKDPDGTYDALGTKADGTKVMYDVSTDLATISDAHGPGQGGGGKGNGGGSGEMRGGRGSSGSTQGQPADQQPTGAPSAGQASASPSATATG